MDQRPSKNACVVVLGDIGRSPRMQYHIKSLDEHDFNIDVVGYVETSPIEAISNKPNIKIHKLIPFPNIILPAVLKYLFKTVWQTFSLMKALISSRRSQLLIVQNPPAIPTFFVCYLYCFLMHTKFIIDWHNYAHTILALNTSPGSLLVRLALWIEKYFGSKADANFCVTNAMKEDLEDKWGIKATVLYDRPPEQFHPIDLKEKHEFYMKLSRKYDAFASDSSTSEDIIESSAFTLKSNDYKMEFKKERPGLLVSSTSWTPDEDFNILLKALEDYESSAKTTNDYPNLLCVITGKGPQKDEYAEKISKLALKHVTVITPWLESEEYPTLLASADLGVCLHWSSSGLDLPMKVVDMFGSGLPVCAVNFNCLDELVKDGQNGYVFDDSKQLAEQLKNWFRCFPTNSDANKTRLKFSENLKEFQRLRWDENWDTVVMPVLNQFYAI